MLSATMFPLPGRKALSRPSDWFIRRLHKIRLSRFPVEDDASIFRVQVPADALSHFTSAFGWDGGSTFNRAITSRTALCESIMVVHSRLLIETS